MPAVRPSFHLTPCSKFRSHLCFKNTPFEKEESYSSEPEQSNYGPSHEEHQRLVDELIELKAEKRAREIIEAEQKKEEVRKAKREAEEAQELAKWSKMTPGQAMEEFERLSEIQRAIDVCSQSDTYFDVVGINRSGCFCSAKARPVQLAYLGYPWHAVGA
jgi:hypothetical protein